MSLLRVRKRGATRALLAEGAPVGEDLQARRERLRRLDAQVLLRPARLLLGRPGKEVSGGQTTFVGEQQIDGALNGIISVALRLTAV